MMVTKGIRSGMYHAMHRYSKANNKFTKNFDKNKESSYIQYLDASNLYGSAMSQKLLVNSFKWKKILTFSEDFIKNYDENSDKGYIVQVDVKYPKSFLNLHSDLPFLPERKKIKNAISLYAIGMIDMICCSYKSSKTSIES